MSKKVEIEFLMRDKLSDGINNATQHVQSLADRADQAAAAIGQDIQATKAFAAQVAAELQKLSNASEITPKNAAFISELQQMQGELNESTQALDKLQTSHDSNTSATQRLSRELRTMENALAKMSQAGQEGTAEFRAMAAQAGELSDTLGDVRQQVQHLADDDRNLTAFADGLNGLAGGFTAATGMMALFASENEALVKIQTKLQSVMAITMGLQQVYNTLNKTSAFQTILVSRAKDLLTAANTRLAVALGISNAAATALMATLTLGLSVVIAVLITAYEKFSSAQEEAAEKAKEMREIERNGREESIKARYELERYIKTLKDWKGTKEEEKTLVEELNSKYGEALGYYGSAAEWYDVLREKAVAYTQVLFLQAKMQELANRAAVAQANADELRRSDPNNSEYSMGFWDKAATYLAGAGYKGAGRPKTVKEEIETENQRRKGIAVAQEEARADTYKAEMEKTLQEQLTLQKEHNIGHHAKPTKANNASKQTAEQRAKQIAADNKALFEAIQKSQQEIEDKELALLEQSHQQMERKAQSLYNETIARITEEAQQKRALHLKLKAAGAHLSPTALEDIDAEERKLKARAKRMYEDGLVAAMQEGYAKRKQEAQLQHQRTLEQIEKETEEQKKLYARLQRHGAKVSPEQLQAIESIAAKRKAQADTLLNANNSSIDAEEQAELNKRMQAEQAALNQLLATYQDYATERIAIIKQYGDDETALLAKRTEANASIIDAAIAQLHKARAEALKALDDKQFETLKTASPVLQKLFSNMAGQTRQQVKDIIAQVEQLAAYLQRKDITPEGRADMATTLGLTPEALQTIEQSPEKIAAINEALGKLKSAVAQSPFQKFTSDISAAIQKLQSGDIEEGLAGIANSIKTFAPQFKQFGQDLGNIFGNSDIGEKVGRITDAVEGVGTAAAGVGQIMSGDIVGGTIAAVGGISKVVTALDGLFGANYNKYNAAKQQYENYMSVLDGVISRQRKMVESLDAANAIKSYDHAKKLIEGSAEAARQLGRERLNAGASAGSHSIGVRQRKKMMNDQAWADARKALGAAFDKHKIGDGRMTGLFDLSIAQMEKLRYEAPLFWSKLDGDVRKYMEDIIKSGEGIEELNKALTEGLTATSFDNLLNSFQSTLEDMSKGTSDFANDFQKHMEKAMISTVMKGKIEDQLKAWQKQFANANRDGQLDNDEIQNLRKQWDSIVQGAIEQRNTLIKGMGSANTTAQQASRGGSFEALTQTQGTKLEGLFTAGQIHWAAIDQTTQAIAKDTTLLVGTLASIKEDTLYLRHLKTLDQRLERIERDGLRVK